MSFFTASAKRGKPAAGKLAHGHYLARYRGALALGLVGNLGAIQKMTEESHDGDKEVSRSAIVALGTIGDEAAVPALVEALGNEDEWIRCEAGEALTKIGEPAVPVLIGVLTQGDRWANDDDKRHSDSWDAADLEVVARVLKEGDETAVSKLVEALNDENREVRANAAKALGWMPNKVLVRTLKSTEIVSDNA